MIGSAKKVLLASAAISVGLVSIQAPAVGTAYAAGMAGTSLDVGMVIRDLSDEEYLAEVQRSLSLEPDRIHQIKELARRSRPHLSARIDALTPQEIAAPHKDESASARGQVYEQGDVPETTVNLTRGDTSSGASTGVLVGGGLAAVAGLGLVAAAGGGGGSGGGSDKGKEKKEPPAPPPPKAPTTPPPPHDYSRDPAAYLTEEFAQQHGLDTIKAQEAYARGYAGQGITVAVVDSGLDPEHPEFAGRIVSPYNALKDQQGNSYSSYHGTHVAGIIGAARDGEGMHGVAWLSDIMPINFARDEDGYMRPGPNGERVGRAWKHAARNGADVVNNSWGLPGHEVGSYTRRSIERDYPQLVEGMHELVAQDVISVFAAHNRRNPDPSAPASFPLHFPELKGYWVAVAALGTNGELAEFSNACGVAADWCITAPGQTISSTMPEGKYARLSGTSMATPHVAGALAVLKSMFPHLSAPELTQILFESADDMGDRQRYGHGLLNLERATRPIGELVIPLSASTDGRRAALSGSRLRLSAAFGDGVGRALANESILTLDSYGRGYQLDLSGMAEGARDSRRDALHRLKLFGGIEERSRHTISAGPLSITTSSRLKASDPSVGSTAYSRMSFGFAGQSYSAEVSMNPDLGRDFGFRQTGFANAPLMQGNAFDQAHLSLMETGFGSSLGLNLDDQSTLRFGVYTGNVDTERTFLDRSPSLYGAVAELEHSLAWASLRGSVGAVSEEGSFLGTVSEGAFGEDMRSLTYFANLGASFDVTPRTKITVAGSLGHSSFKQNSGLIRSGDNLLTSSFGVGLSHRDFLQEGDALALAVSQPLRVEGGKLNLSLPTSRDLKGGVAYRKVSLNPQPSGREINLQAAYNFEVMEGISTSVGAMHRFNANHIAGRSETLGMVSLSFSF